MDAVTKAVIEHSLKLALQSCEPSDIVRCLAEAVRENGEYDAEISRALSRFSEELEDRNA